MSTIQNLSDIKYGKLKDYSYSYEFVRSQVDEVIFEMESPSCKYTVYSLYTTTDCLIDVDHIHEGIVHLYYPRQFTEYAVTDELEALVEEDGFDPMINENELFEDSQVEFEGGDDL